MNQYFTSIIEHNTQMPKAVIALCLDGILFDYNPDIIGHTGRPSDSKLPVFSSAISNGHFRAYAPHK